MGHSFDTVEKAKEAGYNVACTRHLETYRGYFIEEVDISGGKSFGYRFAVRAEPCGAIAERSVLGTWGNTVTVYTKDLNKVGMRRCYMPMFPPGELVSAIQQAEAAVREAWAEARPGHKLGQEVLDTNDE